MRLLIKIYKSIIPKSIKKFISPLLNKIIYKIKNIFGQNLRSRNINVPNYSKKYINQSFSQQGEDLVLDRILYNYLGLDLYKKYQYVDIGCFHPFDHSVTYLLYLRGWKGLCLDGSNNSIELFKKFRPRDISINCVVGEIDKTSVPFYVTESNFEDSLSLTSSSLKPEKENYQTKSLSQYNINTLFKNNGIQEITVLNIDIEGTELIILKSLDFSKYRPSVIVVEIHGNDTQKSLNSKISSFLNDMGYICLGSTVITFFFVDSKFK